MACEFRFQISINKLFEISTGKICVIFTLSCVKWNKRKKKSELKIGMKVSAIDCVIFCFYFGGPPSYWMWEFQLRLTKTQTTHQTSAHWTVKSLCVLTVLILWRIEMTFVRHRPIVLVSQIDDVVHFLPFVVFCCWLFWPIFVTSMRMRSMRRIGNLWECLKNNKFILANFSAWINLIFSHFMTM